MNTRQPQPVDAAAPRAAFASIGSRYFPLLVALFVGVMLISNVTGTKGVVLFDDWLNLDLGPIHMQGLVTDGAFFLFPLAYVLGDVISEVYGFRAMRRTILAGFAVLILASLCFWLTIHLPAADFYEGQEAFETVAGVVPQFLLAGLAGYVVGEFLNSFVLVKMKERAGERHLWARLLGSTVVGEFADTLVFCSIAATALGISTWGDFVNYTIVGFVWKTLVEIVIMPVTYFVVGWLKRAEPTYQEALDAATAGSTDVP
ncbi:queuosine precursor transporter [Gordonia rubripertincta]|uniref:Probable queuosine precursor transporter n=2 Tax=Gordonia rubripertincta TaxID=36822 RepID=A0AAW4G2R7_GORRU|nr:queuosine precursor transporter [Gordonia rubripertincta]MBM7277395.1 queuosine precursor transporter [Gordonia rubripertincta]MDG6780256.1 queuosine precursor transporter [Gordonia rubripertincta]NKY63543.1 queuosine precursor transporter [Gordonia rubripertincta]QMU20457.1 queuosine precursor transporter [Gordonia rubripertincta]TSD96940.1 queuosine precursor transporter [Gordonia rubripertincta]